MGGFEPTRIVIDDVSGSYPDFESCKEWVPSGTLRVLGVTPLEIPSTMILAPDGDDEMDINPLPSTTLNE